MKKTLPFLSFLGVTLLSFGLFADYPRPWEMTFQEPATPVMEKIHSFHNLLIWIEGGIAIFVISLLLYVIFKFRASKNPVPAKFSHNTLIEIIWTTVPVIILIVIAIPSFKLLYFMDVVPKSELTIKATGHQWYWSYEYPDQKVSFDSFLIEDDKLKPGQMRLLETDNHVVVPVNTNVRVITTSADVIHSWAIPSFGVKRDSVPGRLNETWFNVKKEGLYYGQCSELCGTKHGFMPIVVEAVSPAKFQQWIAMKAPPPPPAPVATPAAVTPSVPTSPVEAKPAAATAPQTTVPTPAPSSPQEPKK
ncbi:cytochrome c oxidase subunit II [Candidatus Bealeia paramacronuclearis]|uniref:cytochrome c oxidase subunit II n=1 Tax=Candidatus Bealeia paramacronuclearis TaxID=1921001 RepID=UPI002F2604FF